MLADRIIFVQPEALVFFFIDFLFGNNCKLTKRRTNKNRTGPPVLCHWLYRVCSHTHAHTHAPELSEQSEGELGTV